MTLIDWIGFAGVTLMLAAYLLNLSGKIKNDSLIYLLLNLTGAGIACMASVLLNYWPFIILEACWTLVSAIGLFNLLSSKKQLF